MKLTRTLAENIRLGIYDAKLDMEKGQGCYEHEPMLDFGIDYYGGGFTYNRIAEAAYWHTVDRAKAYTG